MKILFLNHNTMGRGTYLRCFNLGRNLARLGHQVTLVTSTPRATLATREQMLDGVRVVTMPEILPKRMRNGGLGPLDTLSRILYVMNHRYDVVHAFDHRPAVSFPALVAKYLGKQVLVSEWTDLWGSGGIMDERPRWVRWMVAAAESAAERRMRGHADAITTICSELERRSRDAAPAGCPILRLPGGADTDTLRPKPRDEARVRTGLPRNAGILAYVGFTQYDRRFLLEAFALVAAKMSDAHLLLIGPKGTDVAGHPAADRIHQTGVLTPAEMSEWLAASDVTLLPFLNRGVNLGRWPNKVGDYMAAGRPIVANRTGDLIELFDRYQIGLLSGDSPEDFARCAMALLRDSDLARAMGANALKCAEEEYSWAKLSERLAGFYEAVTSRTAFEYIAAPVAGTRTA